jgi:hypothetical protein
MDGRLYSSDFSLHLLFMPWAKTVHNLAPFAWFTGHYGECALLMDFYSLVTWSKTKTCGVSIFDILFMLRSDFGNPGSMSASLSFGASCLKGVGFCWMIIVLGCLGETYQFEMGLSLVS